MGQRAGDDAAGFAALTQGGGVGAGGGVFLPQAHAQAEQGAAQVIVTATHGVLSGPAVDGLKNSNVSEVIVTNTLPIPPEKRIDKLTVLSIAPSILVMVTSFTRIVVVLSFLRNAMGVQQTPPNAVLISLALFLTAFVMAPTLQKSYQDGIAPLMAMPRARLGAGIDRPVRMLLSWRSAQDVIYAAIEDGVMSIVTKDLEGHSNFRTVEELQAILDSKIFWRVHRSYLVNINRIKEIVPWFKSSYQLKMDDRKQTEIPVSRAQTRKLRELLNL